MIAVLALLVIAGVGTVLSDVALSDELYRTINTFLNLLTVVGGPWVIYIISKKTRDRVQRIDNHINESIEPKVDKVIENTDHLSEWNGTTERRKDQ